MSDRDRKQLSSGHQAGLQSSNIFREKEKILKDKRDVGRKSDPTLSGENAETVYRDRHGKKLDMLNEFMRQQASKEGQKYKLEEAQFQWGTGSVQKKEIEDKLKELDEVALEPFARTVEDPKLEAYKKQLIRDGDPMAAYFESKKAKIEEEEEEDEQIINNEQTSTSYNKVRVSVVKKPKYKGPLPAPNRFKIMPGYRWDAVDRGNKFEHKLLLKMSEKGSYREDEYKYLSSDL